jgi:hypothetical protein
MAGKNPSPSKRPWRQAYESLRRVLLDGGPGRGVAGKRSIDIPYIKSLPIVFQLGAERAYGLCSFRAPALYGAPSYGDSNACFGIPHPFGQHGAARRARPRASVFQIQLESPAASPLPGGRSLVCQRRDPHTRDVPSGLVQCAEAPAAGHWQTPHAGGRVGTRWICVQN